MPLRSGSCALLRPNLHSGSYILRIWPKKGKNLGTSYGLGDFVEGFRILDRGEVARLRAQDAGPHGPAHDLRAAGLRESRDENDPLGLEVWPELVGDGRRELEGLIRGRLVPGLEHAEEPRNFALDLVGDSDRRGFGDRSVCDRSRLELCRPDPLALDVERVVGAAVQEPVAVFVDGCPVAVRPDSGKASPVRAEVALVVAPDAARHSGPGSFAHELADFAV